MSRKRTLLITSVGSLAGQNILDSLNNRRANLKIIGVKSLCGDEKSEQKKQLPGRPPQPE